MSHTKVKFYLKQSLCVMYIQTTLDMLSIKHQNLSIKYWQLYPRIKLFYKIKITVLGSFNQKGSQAQAEVTLVKKHQKEKVTHPLHPQLCLLVEKKLAYVVLKFLAKTLAKLTIFKQKIVEKFLLAMPNMKSQIVSQTLRC